MHKSQYKLEIQKAVLHVRKVKINPEIMLAHAALLEKTTLKYVLNRTDLKVLTINPNIFTHYLDRVCLGPLPTRIVIGFVDCEHYNEKYELNPFNF